VTTIEGLNIISLLKVELVSIVAGEYEYNVMTSDLLDVALIVRHLRKVS
jgi:hypothetical protein